jgi:hypothetical protein
MYVNSEEDPNQTHIERVTALRLHPNLALDQPPSSDITETHHATLPTSFFNQVEYFFINKMKLFYWRYCIGNQRNFSRTIMDN